MKKIFYLTFIVSNFLLSNVYSQIYGCNVFPKIRGPLITNCDGLTTTTSHYYLQDVNGFSGITWELGPNNSVGNITYYPLTTEIDVEWAANAVSLNAYLLVSYNGGGGY